MELILIVPLLLALVRVCDGFGHPDFDRPR